MHAVRFPIHHLPRLVRAPRRVPLGWLTVLRSYGDLVKFTLPGLESYFLFHPDLIRECLSTQSAAFAKGRGIQRARLVLGESTLTAEGETHQTRRRALQPLFRRERLSEYAATICNRTQEMASRWVSGATIPLYDEMKHLTLAIASEVFLGLCLTQQEIEQTSQALDHVTDAFGVLMLPGGDHLRHLPLPKLKEFSRGRAVLRALAQRANLNRSENDLQALFQNERESSTLRYDVRDGNLQEQESVLDELVTLLIAGHETTALMLTWTLFLLAQHPKALERTRAESQTHLAQPEFDSTIPARTSYLRAVLSEAMRLYPPVWGLGRRAVQEVTLCGESLSRGAYVTICPWLLHRDERFYPEPNSFCPDRWLQTKGLEYAYLPFGSGPRRCIGEGFAWMEGMLVVQTLLSQWEIELESNQVGLKPGFTLRPSAPIHMRVKRI